MKENTEFVELVARDGYWWQLLDEGEFHKRVKVKAEYVPMWHEVTDEEKEKWEEEHQAPEPPEPENA